MDPTHIVPLGRGHGLFVLGLEKTQKKGRKLSKKLLNSHFLNSSTR